MTRNHGIIRQRVQESNERRLVIGGNIHLQRLAGGIP